MPNLASVLKEEIARLVRRQLRGETESLKKASSRYRSEIAALKRRIEALEKQIFRLERRMAPKEAAPAVDEESETKLRFKLRSRRGSACPRRRWARSWASPTIYNWEAGTSRPRAGQLAVLAAVRKMGKREVKARLDQFKRIDGSEHSLELALQRCRRSLPNSAPPQATQRIDAANARPHCRLLGHCGLWRRSN